ncbi:hypothetical protein [Streptomyces pseudogriseolus]|uniref:hypothetical protein n=1 Tax=Streptomyces pseudogriseolus TaxID=36817 RepID=UPI003FA1E755
MNQPTAMPCNAAQLHRFGDLSTEHGPHEWIVQPGMDPVRCPGTAASSAGQAPATNHDLREQIAAALTAEHYRRAEARIAASPEEHCAAMADAVLAVLPTPTDRAATLREEADRIDATRADFPIAVQNGITWATAEIRRHAAELRRLADETPDTQTPSMRLARQSVQAMTGTLQQPCPPGCVACATDESHDPEPAAGARQDGDQT